MSKRALYEVCKSLDEPMRILGLPLDEFIPAVLLAVVFFSLGKVITSLVLAVACVVAIRVMKQGRGSGWLLNWCYWHLPSQVMSWVLPKTPLSKNREWIA